MIHIPKHAVTDMNRIIHKFIFATLAVAASSLPVSGGGSVVMISVGSEVVPDVFQMDISNFACKCFQCTAIHIVDIHVSIHTICLWYL